MRRRPPVTTEASLDSRAYASNTSSFFMGSTEGRGPLGPRGLPLWSLLILAALFAPLVLAFEQVFGNWLGLRAAGAGVLVGLLIAALASWRRWELLSTVAAVLVAHFTLGGIAALPGTMKYGFLPTGRTLQLLIVQVVRSWKDVLTLTPPVSAYDGPGILPWTVGLVCATIAGILTVRRGRVLLASLPLFIMAFVALAWGISGGRPAVWPVFIWFAGLLLWWAWVAQRKRFDVGLDVRVGRRGTGITETTSGATASSGPSRSAVHSGKRLFLAAVSLLLVSGIALPVTNLYGPWQSRTVLRDLVEPPLDIREYPTPLAAFRHYTTDLENETILKVTDLPKNARLRIGVMDSYDGTTMGVSPVGVHPGGGFIQVGQTLPSRPDPEGAEAARVGVHTVRLLGPWVPSLGRATRITFEGDTGPLHEEGLHYDTWADAALTTGPVGEKIYQVEAVVPPMWSDGQLTGVEAAPFKGTEKGVPSAVAEFAQTVAAKEQGALGKARAIERHLSEKGFFSNEGSAESWAGHRADRLARMLDNAQLIGDDEQYAVLMALMLHSLGINARVVMGAYPSEGRSGNLELKGLDMHAWVEVEFSGVGWAVFDPTPPRDQVPQTQNEKPRSVPRPQVLQPPEPPEEPAELPPATTDKGTDPAQDDAPPLPWLLILGIPSGILLLLLPIILLLAAKALRRSKRRKGTPATAIAGSWAELVDMAVDSGVKVPVDLTRQETAWMLAATLWRNQGKPGTPADRVADVGDSQLTQGQQWLTPGMVIPRTVAVARTADMADFAEGEPMAHSATAAWFEVDQLRSELRRDTSWWSSLRRTFSLRAARARRRARREAKKAARARARAVEDPTEVLSTTGKGRRRRSGGKSGRKKGTRG